MKIKQFLRYYSILTILVIPFSALYSQKPISMLSWKQVATGMNDEWYGSDESKRVAENVLLYQRNAGGWPKNIAIHKPLNAAEKAAVTNEKGNNDAIFDNGATTTEMKFLAKMFNKTGDQAYMTSFNAGLKFILDAQYVNGGWPMFFPLKKGYYTHITFNDNAIVNILELLRAIANKNELFSSITNPGLIPLSKSAFDKGIDCILKTQIKVKGKPAVWCAQHDELTMLPAKARSYELPSFSGFESVGIIKLLMKLPDPSSEVIKSVQGAVEWLDTHRIKNTRWETYINKDGLKDRKIVHDPTAGDMWARFYDLDTEQPFVCDRDGIKKKDLEEIGYERRNGYDWFTTDPQEVIDKYPEWKLKWVR